jgi:hypothetical protein
MTIKAKDTIRITTSYGGMPAGGVGTVLRTFADAGYEWAMIQLDTGTITQALVTDCEKIDTAAPQE